MRRCAISSCTPTGCWIRKRGRTITSDTKERRGGARSLWRLIRERYLPHWKWFALGTACAAVTSAAAASYGYLLKLIVDALERLAGPETAGVPAYLWWLIGVRYHNGRWERMGWAKRHLRRLMAELSDDHPVPLVAGVTAGDIRYLMHRNWSAFES